MSATSLVSLGSQLFELPSRQFIVFEEVLENFQVPCCKTHNLVRQELARKAKTAFKFLQLFWAAKENRDKRLSTEIKDYNTPDNVNYHWFSLVLALWCLKLTHIQKYFQALHGHRLLRMKMPPGSHEVSQNQFLMKFYTAKMSYLALTTMDNNFPLLDPQFIFLLLLIVGKCRTHRNPIMYHVLSLLFELIVRSVNQKLRRF